MLAGTRDPAVAVLLLVRELGRHGHGERNPAFAGDAPKVILAALSVFFTTAPAAILGAIIGEYLGGESGLGIAMINSQQALQVERTWGIALAATGVASLTYGATALVARLLTPWAPRVTR